MLSNLIKDLQRLTNKEKAEILQRFFKTGKGEYAEGDIFLGITVPEQRKLAKNYFGMSLTDLQKLLNSKIHEYRLTALFILIIQYEKGNEKQKEKIFNFYLNNTKNINNWDLVDLSAPKILGNYLSNNKSKIKILDKLSKSNSLWEKRISILATYSFIKNNNFEYTLKLSKLFLKEKHDLMHKAVGWMLREIGKKDVKKLEEFLNIYSKEMPRTMLRYAIEKFDESKRKYYLNKI
jgi:3-methyladenine DNA glycosylase AlkD